MLEYKLTMNRVIIVLKKMEFTFKEKENKVAKFVYQTNAGLADDRLLVQFGAGRGTKVSA